MAEFSVYGRQQALAAMFTPESFVVPVKLYLALTTTPVLSGDSGDTLTEPDVTDEYGANTSYARAPYWRGSAYWTGSQGSLATVADIAFTTPTGNWGTLTGWALCTAVEAGEVLIGGALGIPWTILAGNTVVVPAGLLAMVQQ